MVRELQKSKVSACRLEVGVAVIQHDDDRRPCGNREVQATVLVEVAGDHAADSDGGIYTGNCNDGPFDKSPGPVAKPEIRLRAPRHKQVVPSVHVEVAWHDGIALDATGSLR